MAASETRVIGLYTELTELTNLKKGNAETLTDYLVHAETASALLKNAGERVSDNLLIAMILKGLHESFRPLITVTTQRKTVKTTSDAGDNMMAIKERRPMKWVFLRLCWCWLLLYYLTMKCFNCGNLGQKRFECRQPQQDSRKEDNSRSRRWCDVCKVNNHDTKFCRQTKSKGKTVESSDMYAFKV